MTRANWIELLYVIAVCGFILSLKWMSAAPTARLRPLPLSRLALHSAKPKETRWCQS